MAFRTAASVSISGTHLRFLCISSRAEAERRARSSQMGCPEGVRAEWASDIPSASPTTCDVAAVPRNWHPPPGDAHALHPSSAASDKLSFPTANRTPIVCTFPASSPTVGGSVTPPGTRTDRTPPTPPTALPPLPRAPPPRRRQRPAPGPQPGGDAPPPRQPHHHRRHPLTARSPPHPPPPRRQRPDQPPEHHRRVVPIRQRIHHPRRP